MRFFLLLALAANLAMFAYGAGFFGLPPAEQGRSAALPASVNPAAIDLQAALAPGLDQ